MTVTSVWEAYGVTHIGEALRLARIESGKTLRAVEEETGVNKDTISRIERGLRPPLPLTVARLATAYGREADELLAGSPAHPKGQPPLLRSPARWEAAVQNAAHARDYLNPELERVLETWNTTKDRTLLKEIGRLLQQAYDAENGLIRATGPAMGDVEFEEVQKADRFYFQLIETVLDNGLAVTLERDSTRAQAVSEAVSA